jgi:SAM-dependent methyltransferase
MAFAGSAGAFDCYSAVAETYATVLEPAYFAAPARDLLGLLRVTPLTRLLDVGCGTGALAKIAARTIDDSGLLVAADRSIGMLSRCRCGARTPGLVACALPLLPHPDRAFDAVTAAFVLSHLVEPTGALVEMARVLKPRGALAVSCWVDAAAASAPGRLWQKHLAQHCAPEDLQAISARQVPSEALLADPQRLAAVLEQADLAIRELVVREFPVSISTRAFLASRSASFATQHVRARLQPSDWQRTLAAASDDLIASFGNQLSIRLRALLACAVPRLRRRALRHHRRPAAP